MKPQTQIVSGFCMAAVGVILFLVITFKMTRHRIGSNHRLGRYWRRQTRNRKLPRLTAKAAEPAARLRLKIGGRGIIAGLCFAGATLAPAQTNAPAPSLGLTNIMQIWDVTGEAAQQPQRIQTDALIYYFDADWSVVFGESCGRKTFIPIADCPTPLKPGQHIAIDGVVIPASQRFLWDQTKIQVLAEDALPRAVEVSDLSLQATHLNACLISIPALIEHIGYSATHHVRLDVLSGTTPASVFVLTDTNAPLPFKAGAFVRLTGVFAPKFNRDGTLIESALWVARREDVQVTGKLGAGPPFDRPVTAIEKILDGSLPENEMIRVVGTVRSHEPGKWVTLWDDTGQVTVQSPQTQPLQFGDRVEAVGLPYMAGVQACLRNALYHVLDKTAPTNPAAISPPEPIPLAAQIQHLSAQDVASQPAVNLRAVLLWSHPNTPFVYVQDASGGIRVVNPTWQETNVQPGAIVTICGTVAAGDYVPVVTNAVIRRAGWRGFDSPQPVSLEQAMTGVDDGSWIELRGFVRNVRQAGGLTHLELTTSRGEFQAWTPTFPAANSLPNSIVRIAGVCSAIANDRRQLAGIQLWVPDQFFIKIEQPGTTNLFAADLRSLGDLRRFGFQNELNERIKTIGTVVLHLPGRYLYLQDGRDTVFALSRQADCLQPGERVEVVGFPGHERGKFLLREAVFRRLGGGASPAPLSLPVDSTVNVDLDGVLAKAEGSLLNVVQKEDHVRLLIRNGGFAFEAGMESVDPATARQFRGLPPGCRLALTGVYEVQNDEYDRPASFLLQLRSWDDIRILARPPWWTLPRLLALLAFVVAIFVVALAWGIVIARKNRLLGLARDQLQTANQELESFSYSVSHDLRAPLRAIDGFSRIVLEDYQDKLDDEGKDSLTRIRAASQRMGQLIDDLLQLSRHTRSEMHCAPVNLSALARAVVEELQKTNPERHVEFVIEPDLDADADAGLMRVVLENLLGNAWKFTGKQAAAKIEFGRTTHAGASAYFVRDNGVGFDMAYASKLFGAFQRLHTPAEFPGAGIGLATVQRIIHRHGGRVWAESEVGHGATFYFSLPPAT
jgi:signal transduction histidine kinase